MQEINDRFKTIYKVIEKFCFDREDPVKAINNLRFFPEGYDAFGIDDEEIKVLRDRILEDFELSVDEIADLGRILFRTGKYEFGTLAILLIKKHRPRLTNYAYAAVKDWLDHGVENWAHADLLAFKILPVFFELELCDLQSFASWRDSRSKYTRRAVIISLMWQRRALDAEAMLHFLTPLIRDREKVVQQALGWFLSDLWDKAPIPVEAFLQEHRETLDSSTLKQATSRMPLSKAKLYRPKLKKNAHKPKAKAKPKFKGKKP